MHDLCDHPDGTEAAANRERIAAWRELGEPIARADGSNLAAFDPDVRFRRRDGTEYRLTVAEARARLDEITAERTRKAIQRRAQRAAAAAGVARPRGRPRAAAPRRAVRIVVAAEAADVLDTEAGRARAAPLLEALAREIRGE